jgi:hypothetical protein
MNVWDSALAALAAEPIWLQVAVAVGAVFVIVMCLEGIRASFLPRRYAQMLTRKFPSETAPPRRAESSVDGFVQPDRAKYGALPRRVVKIRKREALSINPHAPPRPRIQRIAMVKGPVEDITDATDTTSSPAV